MESTVNVLHIMGFYRMNWSVINQEAKRVKEFFNSVVLNLTDRLSAETHFYNLCSPLHLRDWENCGGVMITSWSGGPATIQPLTVIMLRTTPGTTSRRLTWILHIQTQCNTNINKKMVVKKDEWSSLA